MKRLLVLLLLLIGAAVVVAWAALDDQPHAEPGGKITRGDLLWAKHLFEKNVPRARTADTLQTLALSEEELNRLLNYAVVVKPVSGVLADLEQDRLVLDVSLRVPTNFFGHYLNLTAEFVPQDRVLQLDAMRLGSLPLPAWLGRSLIWLAKNWLNRDPAYVALMQSLKRISVQENRLNLDYQWHPQLLTLLERKGAEVLIGAEEKKRLLLYADFVRETMARYPAKSEQPARELVAQVFGFAASRGGDAVLENRAALTAMGAYVSGISLRQLLEGRGRTTRRAPSVLLVLHGRRDAVEHLLIAAAVSANAGSRLANALGLAKEEEDVVSGSGFSFTDLAYDRAGARLAELATGSAADATRQRLAGLKKDTDITPVFSDLPEFMAQAVFVRRFEKVGSPAYLRQIGEIERRLAAHPLYRH